MSDLALKTISVLAVVMTFVFTTSMLVVLMGEPHRIPRSLLAFLQKGAAGRPLVGRRDWRALLIFCFMTAGVLFAEARILELHFSQDRSVDFETIIDLALEAAWVGYLLFGWRLASGPG